VHLYNATRPFCARRWPETSCGMSRRDGFECNFHRARAPMKRQINTLIVMNMVSVVCVVAIVCTSMMFGERLILYIRSEISTCIKFMWLTRLLLGLLYVSQINALCSNTSQSCRCTLPITSDDGTTTVQTPIDSAEGRQRVVPTDESSSLHVEKTVPGGRESNLLRSSFDIQ